MQDRLSIQDVAIALGITIDRVRHWSSALGVEAEKVGRVRHLPAEALEPLREMSALVSGGISPQAAAASIKARPQAVSIVATGPAISSEIGARFEEIEKGMLALVDEVRGLRKENAALRERVASLDPAEGFRRFYSSFFFSVPRVLETCRDRYYHEPLMLPGPTNVVPLFTAKE